VENRATPAQNQGSPKDSIAQSSHKPDMETFGGVDLSDNFSKPAAVIPARGVDEFRSKNQPNVVARASVSVSEEIVSKTDRDKDDQVVLDDLTHEATESATGFESFDKRKKPTPIAQSQQGMFGDVDPSLADVNLEQSLNIKATQNPVFDIRPLRHQTPRLDEPTAERVVNVSIGRIEIKATTTESRPQKKRGEKKTSTNLDEYLRLRSAGT